MKFSVTIPAFKSKYLSEAINSVLSQTYQNFELIIVDDHSPENLKSIVDQFSDQRIRYYRNDINCGSVNVVDNWNICLSYCTGDYVICMGDDDRLLPCCLAEYSRLIDMYPQLYVYHAWTQLIDETGKVFEVLEPRPEFDSFFSMIYCRWNGRKQYIGDFCFEINNLRQNKGYYKLPLAWGSDDITVARAAKEYGISNSRIPCFEYRVSPLTISSSSNKTRVKLQSILLEQKWYEDIFLKINKSNLSSIDAWYFEEILKIKDNNCRNKMLSEIMIDMRSNYILLFKWIMICHQYKIERVHLLKRIVKEIIL